MYDNCRAVTGGEVLSLDLHDRAVKKRLKSDVNRISLAVILNTLLLFIIMLMSMILRSVIAVVNAGIADAEKVLDDPGFWDHMMKSGMEYLLFSILGIQLHFSLFGSAVEYGLNLFGYTAESGEDIAMGGSLTVSMFLYCSFAGPVAEELIYRWFVMRSLQKYGKSFAIVISAVLFGLMHQNLVQSLFGIAAGLVLGIVGSVPCFK